MTIIKSGRTEGNVSAQLGAAEGVPADGYVWKLARALIVPLVNAANRRYWAIIGTVDVPAGATIPQGDVRHDHVGVRGQASSASIFSRIWGSCSLAQVSSPATSNAEIGQCLGEEVDVNNKTGYNLDNLGPEGDVGGQLVASGGTNSAKFGWCLSKLASAAGFFVGMWFREHSLRSSGFGIYFGNVEPSRAIMFGEDYAGGAAMETKAGMNALQMRTTSGPSAAVRSELDRLVMQVGNGGRYTANAANTENLEVLSNAGVHRAKATALGLGAILDNSLGGTFDATGGSRFQLAAGSARTITAFNTMEDGQIIRILVTGSPVTIAHNASIQLQGGTSWTMTAGSIITLERWQGVMREIGRVVP